MGCSHASREQQITSSEAFDLGAEVDAGHEPSYDDNDTKTIFLHSQLLQP